MFDLKELRLEPIDRAGRYASQSPRHDSVVAEVCESMAALYAKNGFAPPWTGYIALVDDTCLGTCAFKTPPANGRVEIAYFTFPPFEGMRIATTMASKLVAIAKAAPEKPRVFAQTKPEKSASTKILKRLGFALLGEVTVEGDGVVWEWQLGEKR